MALLTIAEAEKYIESRLDGAKKMLDGIPVKLNCEVVKNYNDTEDGEELVTMFGSISITAEQPELNEILFLSLEADVLASSVTNECVVDPDTLEERSEALLDRLEQVSLRLRAAEDIGACIRELNAEIDQELMDEYNDMLEKLNASSKSNLKVALIATGVLLGIALICILINLIF
ncbi:MAG: hypothetical protein IJY24_01585 [Clostridia bacterium]|nr:hypothetical protein [Clostridia bacterium]